MSDAPDEETSVYLTLTSTPTFVPAVLVERSQAQLDRIETKLDQILRRMGVAP